MIAAFYKLRNRLVSNAREVWRHWSLRIGAIGAAFVAWFVTSPETAIAAWAMLPPDLKEHLPPYLVGYFGLAMFVVSLLAKFIKQRKLPSNQNDEAKRTAVD